MRYQDPLEADELAYLASIYGTFPVERVELKVTSEHFFQAARTPLGKHRRAEILAVVTRPDGRVLVHTKRFYPPGVYRLISGGIALGEPVEAALVREIREETGLPVQSRCLIGVLAYRILYNEQAISFASYTFRVDVPDAPIRVHDAAEEIADFKWISFNALAEVEDQLLKVPPEWQDWGRFRALGHRFVLRFGHRCGFAGEEAEASP